MTPTTEAALIRLVLALARTPADLPEITRAADALVAGQREWGVPGSGPATPLPPGDDMPRPAPTLPAQPADASPAPHPPCPVSAAALDALATYAALRWPADDWMRGDLVTLVRWARGR